MVSTDVAHANTDRDLWCAKDRNDMVIVRVFLTEGDGIGIEIAGHVIVKTAQAWHALTERDQLREADINNADTIRALRTREGRYRAALMEAKKWVSSYTVQNQIKSALSPVSREEGK